MKWILRVCGEPDVYGRGECATKEEGVRLAWEALRKRPDYSAILALQLPCDVSFPDEPRPHSCQATHCPGCVNCGRGCSNR